MAGSDLVFRVKANTDSAVGGFKKLAASLKPVSKDADAASKSLAKISKSKVSIKVEDKQITALKKEIDRLQDEMRKQLTLDVNADTRPLQRKITGLRSTIRTLQKGELIPPVPPTRFQKIKSGLASVAGDVAGFGKSVGSAFGSLAVPVLGTALVGVAALGTGIAVTAAKALTLADAMENTSLQINSFVHNADATKDLLTGIQKFADTTPFEFPELALSGKMLLGLGLSTKQVVPQLAKIGDVASQAGASVQQLTTIYAQMTAAGRLNAGDMNQLVNAGVNAWPLLAKSMGKSVAQVRKLSEQGKLGQKDIQKFWDTLAKGAKGSTAAIGNTLGGQISTFKDTVNGVLRDIGTAFLPFAKTIVPLMSKGVTGLGDKIIGNLPAVIDGVAGALTGLLAFPGQMLSGLATISFAFTTMVSQMESQTATLLASLGATLAGVPIPEVHNLGLSLFAAAENLNNSAKETDKAGHTAFDQLTAAAKKAQAATDPIAAQIEKARQAAQAGIQLQLKLAPIDSDIAAKTKQINQIQRNIKNPKLKADKKYWEGQLKSAQNDLEKLQRKKTNVKLDAKAAPLKKTIASATAALAKIGKPKTAELRAKSTDLKAKLKSATHALAVINVKKANPKLDANSAAFKKKVAAAERKIRETSKKKATPKIDVKSDAAAEAAKTGHILAGIKDEQVVIHVVTRGDTTSPSNIPGTNAGRGSGPPRAQVQTLNVVTPAPVIQLSFNDPMLRGLIQAEISTRVAAAVRSSQRRTAAIL